MIARHCVNWSPVTHYWCLMCDQVTRGLQDTGDQDGARGSHSHPRLAITRLWLIARQCVNWCVMSTISGIIILYPVGWPGWFPGPDCVLPRGPRHENPGLGIRNYSPAPTFLFQPSTDWRHHEVNIAEILTKYVREYFSELHIKVGSGIMSLIQLGKKKTIFGRSRLCWAWFIKSTLFCHWLWI